MQASLPLAPCAMHGIHVTWPSHPSPCSGKIHLRRQTVRDCSEQNTVQSVGDNRGTGVRQAAQSVFHL